MLSFLVSPIPNKPGKSGTASWVWNDTGFLKQLGFFDFAGSCVVHLSGGTSAFVAAWMLGPRLGRFGPDDNYEMSSPVTALTGTFMLWWAWLGFNCGSTFGIDGTRWKTAAKAALTTINGSVGGGIAGLTLSALLKDGHFDVEYLIMSILGGLVSVTASCAVIEPAVALFLGGLGASTAICLSHLLDHLALIDDPVGAVAVHFGSAVIGTLAVGLFAKEDFPNQLSSLNGLFYDGGFKLLGIQILGMMIIIIWSASLTAACFFLMDKTIGVRMSPEEEILGADWVEHRVRSVNFAQKLEQAFRKLDLQEDGVDTLMKKIVAESADHRRGSMGDGRRIRKLSRVERRQSVVADRVKQLYERQNSKHLLGRSLRAIPTNVQSDGIEEQLPAILDAAMEQQTQGRLGRKVTFGGVVATVAAAGQMAGLPNVPEDDGSTSDAAFAGNGQP